MHEVALTPRGMLGDTRRPMIQNGIRKVWWWRLR